MLHKHKLLFAFLLISILLRTLLLIWSLPLNINGDQWRYEDWGRIAHVYGLGDTYTARHTKYVVNNEPPGTLYIISAAYESNIFLGRIIAKLTHTTPGSLQWVNTVLLHLCMRLPSFITDILMGILVYLFVVKESGEKKAVFAGSLVWLSPIIFYNSSVWGQMDSLNNFFFLLSLFLAFKNKIVFSIIALAISIYIKLSLLPLVPFYFVFLFFLSNKNWKKILFGIILSLFAVIMITLPISTQPIQWLVTNLPEMSKGELQNITNAAFNFWWLVTCSPINCKNIPVIADVFLGISLNVWAYGLFAISTLPFLFLQITKPRLGIQKKYIFLIFSVVAFAVFLFLPKMHDRYLYPFFLLFAVVLGLMKDYRKYFLLFCLVNLFYLPNIIYSFYPTYFPAFIFYQILYSNVFRWSISLLLTLMGAVVYLCAWKEVIIAKNNKLTSK